MEKLGPILVAVVLFLVMGAITIAAIKRYEFSQVLKIWNAQIGVFGVMIGMMGTYFYAQASIQSSNKERALAIAERDEAEEQLELSANKLAHYEHNIADLTQQAEEYKSLIESFQVTSRMPGEESSLTTEKDETKTDDGWLLTEKEDPNKLGG
jgi:hypothetical protein